MKNTILDCILLVLYLPLTLIMLMTGMLREDILVSTDFGQLFTAYVMGYPGPALGLLTYPCLLLSIWLRNHGKTKISRWLRFAPPLIFAALFAICTVVELIF